jgi:hypothetical protein
MVFHGLVQVPHFVHIFNKVQHRAWCVTISKLAEVVKTEFIIQIYLSNACVCDMKLAIKKSFHLKLFGAVCMLTHAPVVQE